MLLCESLTQPQPLVSTYRTSKSSRSLGECFCLFFYSYLSSFFWFLLGLITCVCCVFRGTIDDCELVDGLVLTQRVANTGVTRVEKAKIGLIQFCLSPPKTDVSRLMNICWQENSFCLIFLCSASDCNSELQFWLLQLLSLLLFQSYRREDIVFSIYKTLSVLFLWTIVYSFRKSLLFLTFCWVFVGHVDGQPDRGVRLRPNGPRVAGGACLHPQLGKTD